MVDRIKKIMKEKGYNAAAFAKAIDMGKSNISLILNSERKPSLEIVQKTLDTFPDINPDWLLSGTEPMYRSKKAFFEPEKLSPVSPVTKTSPKQLDLYSNNPANTTTSTHEVKETKEKEDKTEEKTPEKIVIQEVTPPVSVAKKIGQIMIFYSDKTYDSFSPDFG